MTFKSKLCQIFFTLNSFSIFMNTDLLFKPGISKLRSSSQMDFFPFIDLSKTKTIFRDVMSLDWKWPVSGKSYWLRGPYGINLRQRAAFSSPRSDFFTVRIFPQPVNSLLLLSLFFSSWVGGILQFCDPISSKNSSNTLPSASPPPVLWKRRKKSLSAVSKKQKKE